MKSYDKLRIKLKYFRKPVGNMPRKVICTEEITRNTLHGKDNSTMLMWRQPLMMYRYFLTAYSFHKRSLPVLFRLFLTSSVRGALAYFRHSNCFVH